MQRRRLLATLAAGTVGLAGCTESGGGDGGGGSGGGSGAGSDGDSGGGGSDGGTGGGGDGDTDGGSDGDTGDGGSGGSGGSSGWSLPDHPSVVDVGSEGTEPWLGPPPGEAPGLVVAFEDPSCTICGRFENGTFPELASNLIEPGDLTFVYRVQPIVYQWGKPATQALEATLAEGGRAPFWALKDHYYAEQDAFGTSNVLDLTESFLASETDVDAAAVVAAAEEKRYDDRVQADLAAGNEAGVGSVPAFFLFREGEFRTKVSGAQSYDVFATALGF